MQCEPALNPGTVAESVKVVGVTFQDPFCVVYRAEALISGASIGVTEYFPSHIAVRTPEGNVEARSAEQQMLFDCGREHFAEMAKGLSALRHPNLLRYEGIKEARGTVYAFHALEQGQSVANAARATRRAPQQNAIDSFLVQLLSGLILLHSRGLIHANINPDAILLRPDPLLIRFGANRAFLAGKMRKVHLSVTPGYSAPELHQFHDQAYGPLCDIYSLAATLYFIVTGRNPINVIDRGLGEIMPRAAAMQCQGFRPGFLEAIDKGLELEPERRPQTMEAFRDMLL